MLFQGLKFLFLGHAQLLMWSGCSKRLTQVLDLHSLYSPRRFWPQHSWKNPR